MPQFVSKIGVITSPSGAVIRDIITTVSRRFPGVEILLFPTKVQGDGAAQEVVANIRRANQREDLDLLIVGRGGGSIEDLWAFNEEIVVQVIFESQLPVISSVGHETDTTLADFVADRRAATPTAAAELATPITKTDLMSWIVERQNRSYQACLRRIKQWQEWVDKLSQSVIFRQPERLYDAYLQKIDRLSMTLMNTMKDRLSSAKENKVQLDHALANSQLQTKIERYQDRVATAKRLLMANMASQYDSQLARFEKAQDALLSLDASRIIARGYAMIEKNQALVASVSQITKGDQLTIKMRDGQLDVEVKDVKNENI
ncbi:putative exodeoxyribonuclease VII, large subunit [Streptococcus pyogenes GA03747]|nr:putative exodeoxyribonuclease VII, large subunit [Streptococcus pyogenes GA03747]